MKNIIVCSVVICVSLLSVPTYAASLPEEGVRERGSLERQYDMAALRATTNISNQSGARIVADFYANSKVENTAISPPTIISTFGAIAHIAKGKTKQELQKLLFLRGNERLAFSTLNDYLSEIELYDSRGYLLVKGSISDINGDMQSEILEKFGTAFRSTDLSEDADGELPGPCGPATAVDFKFIPEINEVIESSPDTALIACSEMLLEGRYPSFWKIELEDNLRPFRFDNGRKSIPFLYGSVDGYQMVTINGERGYRFQLDVADMAIVQCKNGTALKQLAKNIATNGMRVQSGRRILRQTALHIPEVGFLSEFNLVEYAKVKGLATPFTPKQAEYIIPGIYCSNAFAESAFEVSEYGIGLVQRQILIMENNPCDGADPGAMDGDEEERNRRLLSNIIIDSPYLMVITERRLGTILAMAFIANPEIEVEEEFDDDSED